MYTWETINIHLQYLGVQSLPYLIFTTFSHQASSHACHRYRSGSHALKEALRGRSTDSL